MDRTHDGRPIKIMTVIDEYSRECLALLVDRKIKSNDVLFCLSDLFLIYGVPDHIRSDNGPEFTAKLVREWLERIGSKTLFIEPGSPWENGYNESFNGKLHIPLKSATHSALFRPAVPEYSGHLIGAKRRWIFSTSQISFS